MNCPRHGFRKAHLARDLGAAIAPCFHQFMSDLAAVLEDVNKRAKSLGEPGVHSGVRDDETQHLRQAAIDRFEVVLEGDIVGHIKLADARRIAAAAEIFQQQRVVKLPDLRGIEADLPADMDSDPTAAHAVSGRLAFHHVERMAERAEDLGEPDLGPLNGLEAIIRHGASLRNRRANHWVINDALRMMEPALPEGADPRRRTRRSASSPGRPPAFAAPARRPARPTAT